MDSNINKTILLIGAGQLGSRHLQGLLKLQKKNLIFVLDPSAKSLEIAEQRAGEVPNKHQVKFVQNWDSLPKKLDLAIVATNSDVREQIVTKLLEGYAVQYMVLEKVLFQEVVSYQRVSRLINEKSVITWINHPRRMMEQYKIIKNIIAQSGEPVLFNLLGGNWGMGCNGLHFIDLFGYLADSEVETIENNWIDDLIYPSKRKNYVEFTGTLKGSLKNNCYFTISSLKGDPKPITLNIASPSNRWFIHEGAVSKVIHLSKGNLVDECISLYNMEFQSTLTTRLAHDIFEKGTCDLPTYEDASLKHISFLTAFLEKYNNITNSATTICPIT